MDKKIIGFLCFIIIALLAALFFSLQSSKSPANTIGVSKDEVKTIIENHLKQNPDIIISALQQGEADKERKNMERAKEVIASEKEALLNDANSAVIGNKDGDVTIVEFFDYACGYCKRSLTTILKVIKSDPNVRVVLKEFPILGNNSTISAKAAIIVHKNFPDKYMDFHSKLMKSRVTGMDSLLKIAESSGIDVEKIKADMESDYVKKILADNYILAEKIGIRGTPAFIIGENFSPGAIDYNEFMRQIRIARGQ